MSEINNNLKLAIDSLFGGINDIDLNECTPSNTLLSQVKALANTFKTGIRKLTRQECLDGDSYFQSKISSVTSHYKSLEVNKKVFKGILQNKKDRKIKINYKKLTSAKIKELHKMELIAVSNVDKSGGESNVQRILDIFEENVNSVINKLKDL